MRSVEGHDTGRDCIPLLFAAIVIYIRDFIANLLKLGLGQYSKGIFAGVTALYLWWGGGLVYGRGVPTGCCMIRVYPPGYCMVGVYLLSYSRPAAGAILAATCSDIHAHKWYHQLVYPGVASGSTVGDIIIFHSSPTSSATRISGFTCGKDSSPLSSRH